MSEPPALLGMTARRWRMVQESEVVKVGHRPRLQLLVTDAWLLVAAVILRREKRPAPRGSPATTRGRFETCC